MPVSYLTANGDLDSDYGSGTPATIYAALATATPDPTGNGGKGTMVEPTQAQYAGYARVAITNNTTNWPASVNGSKANGVAFTFPASTGGANSPVVVTYLCFVTTNDSTYRIIDYIALPANTSISSGTAPAFPVNSITITES